MTAADDYAALPGRGQWVIDQVYRHWLLTADTARRRLGPDLSPDAARKALGRLADDGWLVRHPLAEQESYFVLGGRALAALGVRRPTAALGHQALLEHYAVLLACTRRGCGVITEHEFRDQFPDLCEPGLSAKNFFVDTAVEPPRLGLLVVDHDKDTKRLRTKVFARIGRLMETERHRARQMVLDGELTVAVVTAHEGKRANLQAAFARKPHRTVTVTVEAHPELEPLFLLNRR